MLRNGYGCVTVIFMVKNRHFCRDLALCSRTVANTLAGRFFRLILLPTTTSDGMALIPSGSFTIGDTLAGGGGDNIPANVYVSAFYMDTNLVSYSLWQSVYSYATSQGYGFDDAGSAQTINQPVQPVETVNWYDVVK
jgi:hypothetical protein